MTWSMPLLLVLACGTYGLDGTPSGDTGRPPRDPPPTSPVGGDTELHTDTGSGGTSTGGTSTGGQTPPDPSPPEVTAFSAWEESTQVRFAFTVVDPDDDLTGGQVVLTLDGVDWTFRYPQDIRDDGNGGDSVLVPLDEFVPEQPVTCKLRVEDNHGLSSPTVSLTFTRETWRTTTTEVGDDIYHVDWIGAVVTPGEIAGDLYATGHTWYDATTWWYDGDLDYIQFQVVDAGTYDISLSWGGSGDYDILLFDVDWNLLDYAITETDNPERFTTTLYDGVVYNLLVAGYSGPAGPYTVRLE